MPDCIDEISKKYIQERYHANQKIQDMIQLSDFIANHHNS